jgi:hypothetical protein
MDYILIIQGVIIGAIAALVSYGAGKIGQQMTGTMNYVKMALCMVVGGVFGFIVAYGGGMATTELITVMFGTFTISGFGIVFLIDFACQIIGGWIAPQSKNLLIRSMVKPPV